MAAYRISANAAWTCCSKGVFQQTSDGTRIRRTHDGCFIDAAEKKTRLKPPGAQQQALRPAEVKFASHFAVKFAIKFTLEKEGLLITWI